VIYKLSFNYENFLNLDVDLEELGDEIGEVIGEEAFYNYSWDNISLKDNWVDVGASFEDVGLEGSQTPDITAWNGANLVLSPKAYAVLKDVLAKYGEFLPLTISGEDYQVFNCLNVVAVDKSQSETDIVNGLWMGVKNIGFDEKSVSKNLLFKTKFDRCGAIYCGTEFRTLIETSNLKGLLFLEDLVSGF